MVEDNITNEESIVDFFNNQFDILLALLSRPAVQLQILAVLVILLIAWLLPEGIRYWWTPKCYRHWKLAACAASGNPTDHIGLYGLDVGRGSWLAEQRPFRKSASVGNNHCRSLWLPPNFFC